ncbi:MAG: aldehyde dehydrogenase [Weeksellaceae bacterium]|nr:aldehyde dehydrogenase [Weeksellaceae bacterium]
MYTPLVQNQRKFFLSQGTKSLDYRKDLLLKLRSVLQENEVELQRAVHADFGKSRFDFLTTEMSMIYNELDFFLKNLDSLAAPTTAKTNLSNLPALSSIHYDPLGVALIIAPWNYPVQLSFTPAIAALAAGNTVILKPSELTPKTSEVIAHIINSNFSMHQLHVVEGGVAESKALLEQRFDKIFFTGSVETGRKVYKAAAEHLTPVTLELGGKSPCIVAKSAPVDVAAKRIVWGKFLNAGQTCIAPDYIYVHSSVKDELIARMIENIEKAEYEPNAAWYPKIVNFEHFERILKLIDQQKVVYGGQHHAEKRYIQPTLMDNVSWDDAVMGEEVFGPVLPILCYEDWEQMEYEITHRPSPLAAYLFSRDSHEKARFKTHFHFGGGCINDVVMHVANPHLPFGGVQFSGTGSYHGKFGFEAFSHAKPIMHRATFGEPNIKYPPYTEEKLKWVKKLL